MGLKDRFAQPIQSIRRSIADKCDQMLKKKLAQYIFQKLPQNIVSEKVQFFKLAQTVANNLGFFEDLCGHTDYHGDDSAKCHDHLNST